MNAWIKFGDGRTLHRGACCDFAPPSKEQIDGGSDQPAPQLIGEDIRARAYIAP